MNESITLHTFIRWLLSLKPIGVIARRSRSNLTVLHGNDGEIAALPSVARNDHVIPYAVSSLERESGCLPD